MLTWPGWFMSVLFGLAGLAAVVELLCVAVLWSFAVVLEVDVELLALIEGEPLAIAELLFTSEFGVAVLADVFAPVEAVFELEFALMSEVLDV